MNFLSQNVNFDQKKKKAPAAMGQQEGNGVFPRETLFLGKKSACGNRLAGGEK